MLLVRKQRGWSLKRFMDVVKEGMHAWTRVRWRLRQMTLLQPLVEAAISRRRTKRSDLL